jgi:hypothetical protein
MILINDNWAITTDSNSYNVCKKIFNTDKETGEKKVAWSPVTYHSSLQDAIKALVKRFDRIALKTDEEMTLQDAIKVLEENHMKMKVLIEGAVPDIEVKLK